MCPHGALVLTHGYFTGLGFFFRNIHELSRVPGWDVYAIDWLGMGRSSRPPYNSRREESEDARVAHAENFFIESLEEWRQRMGIERMTLCGHSFGGYMSALYALKYPERVEKLVLVSPIGVPAQPTDFEERLRGGYGPARQRLPVKGEGATSENEEMAAAESMQPSRSRVLMFRLAMSLWERNYAPQWLVRSTGPFSRRLIDLYVGRFDWLSDTQRRALAAYTHQITVLPGSSEAALGDILRPGAFARRPLVDRLGPISMPTVFMYGANDWVDHAGGAQAIRRIAAAGNISTGLFRVPNAGHNLHLENPTDFNRILADEMRAISEKR
ncbi:alpha/beta-hydrolase [Coemansia reversa NRRL 1564]|uniref:Alpha/beta-hydrolase n=1 Tax=Coemansia reversa (strain ATCC 12441 / NRRL 1564) TaxID=763665 RepID=A0A2G5B9G3_COERN|nr:alpha/beta-hydrolase [Coemansia reversa NRRL 1564]|eukprot:PIA15663.1 alpha/beta-hydrolase [Coemansia reversa NRRL 1564]